MISTPNLASLPNLLPLVLGKQPFHAHVSNEVYVGTTFGFLYDRKFATESQSHLRVFTYCALKELLQYHGFSIERIVSVGFFPFTTPFTKFLCSIFPRHGLHLVIKVRRP